MLINQVVAFALVTNTHLWRGNKTIRNESLYNKAHLPASNNYVIDLQ